jgi:carbon starvation protein
MSALVIFLLGIAVFAWGYRYYAGRVARLFPIDVRRPTPAVRNFDGVDFVPAKNWFVLFGHHFSSIAGAGPIIGPVIGCIYWGWLPALVWIVVGTVVLGGVHDFATLMVSVREEGCSIPEVTGTAVSVRARWIFSVFVWLALVLVVAVFAHLCAQTFVTEPRVILPSAGLIPAALIVGVLVYKLNANFSVATLIGLGILGACIAAAPHVGVPAGWTDVRVWTLVLLGYAFVASVLPVNVLLQPRDYLCSFLLIIGVAAGILGLVWTRPVMVQPAFTSALPAQGALWPMMCVTIACGAISGFHAVVASGTTSKQLANERYARRVGYGGMVVEGVVALIAVVAVSAGIARSRTGMCLLLKDAGPICVYGEGYAGLTRVFLGDYGKFLAVVILNAFILTTLDTATRVCRYITEELMGIRNRFVATGVTVVAAGALALSGAWNKLWPAFGASNQLVAALAFFVVTCWFLARGKSVAYTLWAGLFMFVTTMAALVLQARTYAREGNMLLVLICVTLMVLALIMLNEVRRAFARHKPRTA